MLMVMLAPVEVFLVIVVALAITGALCYKKRRSLFHRSGGSHLRSEFVHRVHSPEMTPIPVQLGHSLSSSIPILDVTPPGLGTPSSISLQSYNEVVVDV